MCAWRYQTDDFRNTDNFFSQNENAYAVNSAFLAQNATVDTHSAFYNPSDDFLENDEQRSDEEDGGIPSEERGNGGFFASPQPPSSGATPFGHQPTSSDLFPAPFIKDLDPNFGEAGNGDATARRKPLQGAFALSRRLFRSSGDSGMRGTVECDDDCGNLPLEDRNFVQNTRELFEEVDPELLSENFAPYTHVVGIILSEATGADATPAEIEEKVLPYKDLKDEIDLDLGEYIEVHHDEFNKAIFNFSEMILAVSGSDDSLARLKRDLAQAATSLDSHAEQLHVLRLRAVKSLLMTEMLQRIQEAINVESDVRGLIASKHYLRAVQLCKIHSKALREEQMQRIRATQGLRENVESTMRTLHTTIIDDLMDCVFRKNRLARANIHQIQQMIQENEVVSYSERVVAPDLQSAVLKYSQSAGWVDAAAEYSSIGVRDRGGNGAREDSVRSSSYVNETTKAVNSGNFRMERTLKDVLESISDNPDDDSLVQDYFKFIPLCVKSLLLLGKIDNCHEAFFSRAAKRIEWFIARFLRLYNSWRQKLISSTNLAGSNKTAIVQATTVQAFSLTNDTVSMGEAIAMVQSRDLRTFLSTLFAELEEIMRNADYLYKIILVAYYPFVSEFITQPAPFDVEKCSTQWKLWDVSLDAHLSDIENIINAALRNTEADLKKDKPIQSPVPSVEDSSLQGQSQNQEDRLVLYQVREFFTMENFLKANSTPEPGSIQPPATGHCETNPSSTDRKPCLRTVINFLDSCINTVAVKYSDKNSVEALKRVRLSLAEKIEDSVRGMFVQLVRNLCRQWDLQALWSQLNYHIEFVLRVLCDAQEANGGGDDDVAAMSSLSRQRSDVSRTQRMGASRKEVESHTADDAGLDRLLSTYSSSGLLRMTEEVGSISFSLVDAVKRAHAENMKISKVQLLQSQTVLNDTVNPLALMDAYGSDGGGVATGGTIPSVLSNASVLQNWFVFTVMNVLTCYGCASHFVDRCCDCVPEIRLLSRDESVLSFFKEFFRTTYIPALHSFHSQKLLRLFAALDTNEKSNALKPQNKGPAQPLETSVLAANIEPKEGTREDKPLSRNTERCAAWPTVNTPDAPFPLLTCVHYVGKVIRKVTEIRSALPASLAEAVEQNVSENFVVELTAFLMQKLQSLAVGTIQHHLINTAFEHAFAEAPDQLWSMLCDEERLHHAHDYIDRNLFLYYQYNCAQRTSGHEYNATTSPFLDLSLESKPLDYGDTLDEKIGLTPPNKLCLGDDGSIVALAATCFSTEWLCEEMKRDLWPDGARLLNYPDCCVPGHSFRELLRSANLSRIPLASGKATAQQMVRLAGHLTRLYALSQLSLFFLSIEARFMAFCFLPQLRDECYSSAVISASADTFVQAYARSIKNFYALLKQYLPREKIKYTCLTLSRPAGGLVLMEMARLRDKCISSAGLARLNTNLMVLQAAFQHILPTDIDVHDAVSNYLYRPAVFLRYIRTQDVVNELIATEDYRHFTTAEIEELIQLVLRQARGVGEDGIVRTHIAFFHSKLKALEASQKKTVDGIEGEGWNSGLWTSWRGSDTSQLPRMGPLTINPQRNDLGTSSKTIPPELADSQTPKAQFEADETEEEEEEEEEDEDEEEEEEEGYNVARKIEESKAPF